MLLAFDDTDAPDGGCTTHAVFRMLLSMPGVALGGMPRLVRLNPNWPRKTRGNGAVCLSLAAPTGPQVQVGELLGHEIRAFPEGRPITVAEADAAGFLDDCWDALQGLASKSASPGMVAVDDPPTPWLYHAAVTTELTAQDAQDALGDDAVVRGADPGGWIGAAAATAWPGPPTSYELIAYRMPENRGSPRRIETTGLHALDSGGATFHSWDAEAERPACIPSTPCPVLCGLRGRDVEHLRQAATGYLRRATREPLEGWLLWSTNHASGDHITRLDRLTQAPPYATVEVAATVQARPVWQRGGRVEVGMQDAAGEPFLAVAFEPTKSFRDLVALLRPGDGVRVVGRWRDGTVQLESFCVQHVADVQKGPACVCGGTMRSHGRKAWRCPRCHERKDRSEGDTVQRPLQPGTYEVPVLARRHLHEPAAWRP